MVRFRVERKVQIATPACTGAEASGIVVHDILQLRSLLKHFQSRRINDRSKGLAKNRGYFCVETTLVVFGDAADA